MASFPVSSLTNARYSQLLGFVSHDLCTSDLIVASGRVKIESPEIVHWAGMIHSPRFIWFLMLSKTSVLL